ncbi:MAG: hypothetical protein ACR2QT_05940 [Woeseiaceae bacterium]
MKLMIVSLSATALLMGACSNASTPESSAAVASHKPDSSQARTSKVQSPVQIEYSVIGTPIVGQAVAVDLKLKSTLGTQPYKVSFRVNDPTAMQFPQSQSATVSISPPSGDKYSSQQVTVIPLREGRLYLNVAAVIETDSGTMQTVTAVPIQVGPEAPRQIIENGTVTSDADGNLIRSLPAEE